jgi:hypothetical protein
MLTATNQLPTLGYLHKVVCDCLGLWNSENEDFTFHIDATEKEQRTALRQAFNKIKKEDGRYGSLNDLLAVTVQFAPTSTQKIRKSRTIQSYVNHLSKSDFESIDEYIELRQYIETLITERYSKYGVARLAVSFYVSALGHYREFIREYACNKQNQNNSFQYFINKDLHLLLRELIREQLPNSIWPKTERNNHWPLKGFADMVCQITSISMHQLHQYHELKQKNRLRNEQEWLQEVASGEVNTKSKQIIGRLRKNSRMKWKTFYSTLKPLTHYLPKDTPEEEFAIHAFSAMIEHHINIQVADLGPFELPIREHLQHAQCDQRYFIPSSELLDLHFNDYPIAHEYVTQQVFTRYQDLVEEIKLLPDSLNHAVDIPSSLALIYKKEYRWFIDGKWLEQIAAQVNSPSWISEWTGARDAILKRDSMLALIKLKSALEQAKYMAGPLFVPFYIEVCAFCKSQYQLLSKQNKVELFDQIYECLGSDASQYAELIGYSPYSIRDPKNLMPRINLPKKFHFFSNEANALAQQHLGN